MVLGMLGLLGAALAVVGAALGKSAIIGIGVLLFFSGFFITAFTAISIPTIVWVFLIVLFIWGLSKKR